MELNQMVTKWRPNKEGCLYVIPDVHGQLHQLKVICASILPLRHTGGVEDRIIFLGDYIDRGKDSHLVLDFLIELKKKYKDKITFLRGNHESMFLDAVHLGAAFPSKYDFWMVNGGINTLIGYLERVGEVHTIGNPHSFARCRLIDIVPKEHIEFLKNSLENYKETDTHIFVHAGCDPNLPMDKQELEIFWWDRSLYSFVKRQKEGKFIRIDQVRGELPWEKVIVTGHNTSPQGIPYITDKFMMLDCSGANNLIIYEVNSGSMFKAQPEVTRLVRIDYQKNVDGI
jgi:serine/threonine protein phosphatase 1